MKYIAKKKTYKKIALVLSLCTIIIWAILGTGASMAWFADTSPEINNIFHFADFDLDVSYRSTTGKWEEVDSGTKIFDENALYEPGYLQKVYLKVENKGNLPFKLDTAINVNGYTFATNALSQRFVLQDYLRFGFITFATEEEMDNSIYNREAVEAMANAPLHNYYEAGAFELEPNKTKYVALIVRMPKEVGNVANYRGNIIPEVELGITIKADQIID